MGWFLGEEIFSLASGKSCIKKLETELNFGKRGWIPNWGSFVWKGGDWGNGLKDIHMEC